MFPSGKYEKVVFRLKASVVLVTRWVVGSRSIVVVSAIGVPYVLVAEVITPVPFITYRVTLPSGFVTSVWVTLLLPSTV